MQGPRRFLDVEVLGERALPQGRHDGLRLVPHRDRGVELSPGVDEPAADTVSNVLGKELKLPGLNGRDQPRPEDRPATEVQLGPFVDVVLVILTSRLGEVFTAYFLATSAFGNQ